MYQYRLKEVAKVYGRHQVAIDGISLDVKNGERVALIGPSGGGKTTLFRMLNCTFRPTSGKLWINGDETGSLYGSRLREVRRKIGTIYQQHNLVPRLGVVHNVLSGQLGRWSLVRSLASLIRPANVDLAYNALKK
ncbi:MAG: ATP-binding cassette domain-containing protein, partial [Candidatus Binatia bacterium]